MSSPAAKAPTVLPLAEQYRIRDQILGDRLKNLLPRLMEECGVNLWLILCREYHEDPLFKTLCPSLVLNASRLSILAFARDQTGFRAINLGRPDPRLAPFYEQGFDPRAGAQFTPSGVRSGSPFEAQWEAVAALIRRYGNKAAVNTGETCAMADGLSATLLRDLEAHLPEGAELESAEPLAIRWLETRTAEELARYREAYAIAMGILKTAYSRDLIRPGKTSTTEVEDFIRERIIGLGLRPWFSPDVDLQRRGETEPRISAAVIQAGDLLHTDMGLEYLGLCTDTQRLGYVLGPGEGAVPPGILRGVEQGRRFQDIVGREFAENRRGNEMLKAALDQGRAEGLRPMLYSHPIGYYGHGAGPCIGLFDNQDFVPGGGENRLHRDTCFALELNVIEAVPEWDGQDVWFMLEETVSYPGGGIRFMDDQRSRIYTI